MRSIRLFLIAFIAIAVAPPVTAHAQVGSSTDIITGQITGPDGKPLPGAKVEATSIETGVTRSRTTGSDGRFRILFPDGGGSYRMTAKYLGMAQQAASLARQADEDRLVWNIRMSTVPQQLSAVVVRGTNANTIIDRAGPGSIEKVLTGDQLNRLPIDPSDPAALAALTPGVVAMSATDTSSSAFSVAGQRIDQNQITLDGLSFLAGGGVPTEAVRRTSVITNTYDVARGQFTGGQVNTTTRGGTNDVSGSFAYGLRDPNLEWSTGDQESSTFASGYTQHQLSGGVGGPIIPDKLFYFGAFQARRRIDPLQVLTGADPVTLTRLGTQPDSAAHFIQLVQQFGLPLELPGIPDNRLTDNGTGIVRFDYHVNEDHSLMFRGNWSGSLNEAYRTSPFALATHAGTQHTGGGGGMVSLSSVVGNYINELRATYSVNNNATSGYLNDPEGRVLVTSSLADSVLSVSNLQFGGNAGMPTDGLNNQFEGSDEVSWMSDDASHRFKLGGLVNVTGFSSVNATNRNGTFSFNSLSDFANNRPATYTRTLAQTERSGSMTNAGLYLGDTWRHSRALQVTYGLRAEETNFNGKPQYNAKVDQLFGRRTDDFPSEVQLSPRMGFTWMLGLPPQNGDMSTQAGGREGRGGFGGPGGGFGGFGFGGGNNAQQPYIIRGGIGEFRGRSPFSLFQSALNATGLATGETQLVCVGPAVPIPDWQSYLSDPSTVPSQCAQSTVPNPTFATQTPNVTVFEPDFGAPRSWRGSLGLSHRFHTRYAFSADYSYALGTNLYGVRDLNFNETPRFTLGNEGNRPVYVPIRAIVPQSGAVSLIGSRKYSEFAQVFDVTSGLMSRTNQITFALNGISTRNMIWNVAYTYMRSSDQTSFSGGSAAGGFNQTITGADPNVIPFATSDLERRHSIVGQLTWLVQPWLDLTSTLRFTSGQPYSPRVGSDINGDGARNDLAYIFDPAKTPDSAVANGIQRLLTTGPKSVRDCLAKQLGQIASRNSCTTSWSQGLDLQANIRPWLGQSLGRRLMISVAAINPLAGLDQLLHGANNLQGWGQPFRADPTLLYVRGFDPAKQQFIYQVNERFGDNPASRTAIRVPFQVAITARWQVGPDRQRDMMEGMLRALNTRGGALDVRGIIQRVAPNPIQRLVDMKDTLKLSPQQVVHLNLIADTLNTKNDTLITALQAAVDSAKVGSNLSTLFPMLRPRLQEARNNYLAAIKAAQAVLTPEQWKKVPDELRNPNLLRGMAGGRRPGQ